MVSLRILKLLGMIVRYENHPEHRWFVFKKLPHSNRAALSSAVNRAKPLFS